MRSRSKVPIIQPDVPVRPIAGWEGLYAVAADGRIWSMPRVVVDALGRPRQIRGGWLKPALDGKGYSMISLRRDGEKRLALVHRLVAMAWLPPSGPGQDQVNHKDRDRTNAAVTNLELCTGTENQLHGWMGREASTAHRAAAAQAGLSRRKLSDEQARSIRARIAAGEVKAALAREYRVSDWTIRAIGLGLRYSKPIQLEAA